MYKRLINKLSARKGKRCQRTWPVVLIEMAKWPPNNNPQK
jgi:hypothetical protein